MTGPPLVGTVIAALTLLPLIALAVRGASGRSRIVAQRTAPAHALDDVARTDAVASLSPVGIRHEPTRCLRRTEREDPP